MADAATLAAPAPRRAAGRPGTLRLLLANRLAAAGLFILAAIVLLALAAPVLPLPDPDVTAPADRLQPVAVDRATCSAPTRWGATSCRG